MERGSDLTRRTTSRPGHFVQDASTAVLRRSCDRLQVGTCFGPLPFEEVTQDPLHVGGDVRRQPERELGSVHHDAQAVGGGVAGHRRR